MDSRKPAIIGGEPVFDSPLPILKPKLPDFAQVADTFSSVMASGQITNGANVRLFEQSVAERLGVRNCIAMSSCTSGMMLFLKAAELSGEVIVPSFTFSATVEATLWAGLVPVFADCLPDTINLDPEDVKRKITDSTCAILGTHVFGNPTDIEALEDIARSAGIHLFFDAAHGFGSLHRGKAIGSFGDAESFSLSPTKLLIAAEGGLVTTNDDELATRLRWGRNYGDPGNYDCQLLGLNARMSEFHATIALASFAGVDERVARRNELAATYRARLGDLPGVSFQEIAEYDRTTCKDFTLVIEESEFGLSRDALSKAMDAENIATKKYFYPPVHQQKFMQAYPHRADGLESTLKISEQVLSLPIYARLSDEEVGKICDAIRRVHHHVREVVSA